MKKKITILSIVAAAVMMTVCVSCKKDEPSKGLDFTNLTLELLESCLDKDSATIVNALIEQGFAKSRPKTDADQERYSNCYYENKSYGIGYGFGINNNKIDGAKGIILYPKEKDKELYTDCQNKLRNRKLPYFNGIYGENLENCTDDIETFFESGIKSKYSIASYANEAKTYAAVWTNFKDEVHFGISCVISYPDDPFSDFNFTKYGCGYNPK